MKLPGLEYDSPLKFTAAQRLQLAVIPPLAAGFVIGWFSSCRWRVVDRHHQDALLARDGRCIMAIWHEAMLLAPFRYRGTNFHSLVSYSFDGELAAKVLHLFGIEAVRGSSSRGGSEALKQLVKAAAMVTVGFTLDGPRGPRRVAKPGVAVLAARTGLHILPHAHIPLRAWHARSWDRFPLPHPFSTIVSAYGEPVPPPPSEHPDDIEQTRLAVERTLNALYARWEPAEITTPPSAMPSGEV